MVAMKWSWSFAMTDLKETVGRRMSWKAWDKHGELEFMHQVHANMSCASVFKGPHDWNKMKTKVAVVFYTSINRKLRSIYTDICIAFGKLSMHDYGCIWNLLLFY